MKSVAVNGSSNRNRREKLKARRARKNLFRLSQFEQLERRELMVASLSVNDISVLEGHTAQYTISLSEPVGSEVTVAYTTVNGTAVASEDYQATSGTLTFAANETSKTLNVSTIENSYGEFSRQFTLQLSNPQGATISDSQGTATITDDDTAPAATISGPSTAVPGMPLTFSVAVANMSPADTSQTFTFNLDWNGDNTTDQQVTGSGSGVSVPYTYTSSPGTITPKVTAVDPASNSTSTGQTSLSLIRSGVIGSHVYFGGTTSDDAINVYPGTSGNVYFRLNGTATSQYTVPSGGHVIVYGSDGDDTIQVVSAPYALESYGGDGADYIAGGGSADLLYGGAGNDRLLGGSGDDYLDAGGGNDTLNGGNNNDIILAGDGNDTVNGDAGDDVLSGGSGNDTVNGGTENDAIWGDSGVDTLDGGAGNDILVGGSESDVLYGRTGFDLMIGGLGADTLREPDDEDILVGSYYTSDSMRCLGFSGQSNSIFFQERDGRSDGSEQWEANGSNEAKQTHQEVLLGRVQAGSGADASGRAYGHVGGAKAGLVGPECPLSLEEGRAAPGGAGGALARRSGRAARG
jgi:Ca2+-binding RTX toxin-like protein